MKSNDAKYMRFYHLDELVRDGNEIGGMGRDHRNLTTSYSSDPAVDPAYKQDQVCGDRQALADWGYDPQSFAYPGGAENTQVQAIVRDCGFTSGQVAGGLSATGPTYARRPAREPAPSAARPTWRPHRSPSGPAERGDRGVEQRRRLAADRVQPGL